MGEARTPLDGGDRPQYHVTDLGVDYRDGTTVNVYSVRSGTTDEIHLVEDPGGLYAVYSCEPSGVAGPNGRPLLAVQLRRVLDS
jgi:hypothetical protein